MLRFGELEPASYDAPRFFDPELRRLEKLVRITPDRELTAERRRGARLTIDGRVAETPGAHPGLVLDEAGVLAKFARNAPHTQGFCEAVLSAPAETPFHELWDRL